jgi:hypothetical protein
MSIWKTTRQLRRRPIPGYHAAAIAITIALKLCTGIGYKYGIPVRMINAQLGGVVCFDTAGGSMTIEDGNLVARKRPGK